MTGLLQAQGDDLARVLALMGEADSVELKLTVPESEQRGVLHALGLDPLTAEIRQVYFFDTPDLALNQRGLVVRARRTQRKGDDTVVKLRPVVPHELPAGLRSSPDLVVEVDAMPGGHVCSASLKGALERPHVRPTLAGERPLRKLYPDGTHILELSTKCSPGEAFQVAVESKAYLAERGIDLSGEQQTKTKTALEYFAGQLEA